MRRSIHTTTTASLDTTGAAISKFTATDTGALVTAARFINQDAADVLLVSLDAGVTFPLRVAAGGTVDLPMGNELIRLGGTGNCLWWKAATNTCDNPLLVYTAIDEASATVPPRLLSDNGPCYISKSLGEYLQRAGMEHTRGRPFHPMTQGKIERYHRSMKNIILLDNYYLPMELEAEIARWVEYYNNERYHEALGNITPRDTYLGRETEILKRRRKIKEWTLNQRRKANRIHYTMAGMSEAVPVS